MQVLYKADTSVVLAQNNTNMTNNSSTAPHAGNTRTCARYCASWPRSDCLRALLHSAGKGGRHLQTGQDMVDYAGPMFNAKWSQEAGEDVSVECKALQYSAGCSTV
jgi:hypothetical protein